MQFMAGRRPLGSWSWDVSTDRWAWDGSITWLHGSGPPAAPAPAADLVVVHTVRRDREAVRELLAQLRRDPAPFAATLRIRAADGDVVPVAIAGGPEPGRPRVLSGWLVPIVENGRAAEPGTMPATVAELEAQVVHLHRALDTRDLIGQAKGILRARMGLDDRAAFELLSRLSQNANVRLVTVAERLVAHADTARVAEEDRRDFGDALLKVVVGGAAPPD